MGEKIWGERAVGSGVTPIRGEPDAFIVGSTSIGDVVRLPPELGSAVKEVVDVQVRDCVCKSGHRSMCYVLTDGHLVFECEAKGFLWCQTRRAK